jgi:hypothetical protein
MSQRTGFTTARQVFQAFPRTAFDIDGRPADEGPIEFVRTLIALAHRFDAVTYAAFLLPRREAVWWGCQCLRAFSPAYADEPLLAAEAWVRTPEEDTRRAALALSSKGNRMVPTTWLAMAAGHSGGNVAPDGAKFPSRPAADTTAISVKAGVILGLARTPPLDQKGWVVACAEAAIRFAEGGEVKIIPPAPASAAPPERLRRPAFTTPFE